ncbi:12439_t:CDS:10, partial [Cetraspora pellucida]
MIETVDNRDELIKYCFDILWKATEGKIISVTFNKNPLFTVTFNLIDGDSKTLNLEAPKVVLITRENFIKILRVTEQNEKEIAIDDEEEPSNSSTEIAIQESVQNSSFDVEADSTLSINNQISNDSIDLIPIQRADSLSDEYSNSDEENDEQNFDAALTLLHDAKETSQSTDRHQFKINTKFKAAKKVKTNERFDKVNDGRVSSNLIEDSPLKSMNEAWDQSLVANNVQENTSNKVNELTARDKCDEMEDIQMSQQDNTINEKERMEYTSSESPDADLDESQASGRLQSSNKVVNLSQTLNDPEFSEEIEYENDVNTNQVEDNDSDEEIEEQGNLVRKRKINRKYKASKKVKKIDTNIITEHNNETHGGEQNNDVEVLSEGSSLPSIEVFSKITNETAETTISSDNAISNQGIDQSKEGFDESSVNSSNKINESTLIIDKLSKITLENSQQANNPIDEIAHDPLQENSSVDVHNNNQQEDILNKSNSSITTRVESSNSNDSEFSELDDDTDLNRTSVYVDKLKKLRDNFAAGDPSNLFEMYSKPPDKYFEEVSTKISLNPLPSHIKDVNGCLNYLKIWDQHFNHCEKVINDQQYRRIELIYSLSELFFILLTLCSQEQQEESSKKTTNHWKGNNIKTRMYEKLGNKNKRGILMKWTACWRIHHILWVTNITPRELINVDLNATYFLTATNEEYNFLIKELIGNAEFPDFTNPKATGGKVVTVTFNNQLRLATISLDNGTSTIVNLERIADNKNVLKCQLYNKSVSDNSEHDQGMDKLINVVSEMFNQSKNSMQADDSENVCQPNNERVNINNQDDERNDESEIENIINLSRNININIQDNNNDQKDNDK